MVLKIELQAKELIGDVADKYFWNISAISVSIFLILNREVRRKIFQRY
jgi:hypothetical protein